MRRAASRRCSWPHPRLAVSADVPGAQIFLDRKFVGEAPLVIHDVDPGEHRLNVSAEGYEGFSEDTAVVTELGLALFRGLQQVDGRGDQEHL